MRPITFEEGSRELMSCVLDLAVQDYRYLKELGLVKGLEQVYPISNGLKKLKNNAFAQDFQIQELLYFLKNEDLVSTILSHLPIKVTYRTFIGKLG